MDTPDKPKTDAKASRKDRAIVALLEQASVSKAALAVGVHETTLRRWMKDQEFQRKLFDAQAEKFSQSMRCLQQAAPAAAAGLVRTMKDPQTPAHVQVRAMETILKVCQGTLQHEFLNARLAEVQQQEAQREPPHDSGGNRSPKLHALLPVLFFLFLPLLRWFAPGLPTAMSLDPGAGHFRPVEARSGPGTIRTYKQSQGGINDAIPPNAQPPTSQINVIGNGNQPVTQFPDRGDCTSLRVSNPGCNGVVAFQPGCAPGRVGSGCDPVADSITDWSQPDGGRAVFYRRAKPSISVHQAAGFADP